MHQCINVAPGRLNDKRSGDIESADLIRLCREGWKRVGPGTNSKHLPAAFRKQIGCGLTKEAAAYDNDPGQKA
jgi:hypothetical protein